MKYTHVMVKITNLQGDQTDVLAETKTLLETSVRNGQAV